MSELFIKTLNPKGYTKDQKYSYSKISLYEKCGFKYKTQYVDGIWVKSESLAADFGTAIHNAEEDIAKAIQSNNFIDYVTIKNKFILKNKELEHKYASEYNVLDAKGEVPRTYKDKRNEYLEKYVYRLEKFTRDNPTYKIVGIEQPFDFSYDETHYFNGKIDRIFYDEATKKLIIQDIKSWPKEKDLKELESDLLQFAIYMMACELIYGINRKDMICEYDLPLCNTTFRIEGKSLIEEYEPVIIELFAGIDNKDFKPNPSALCYWCPFNPIANPQILTEKPNGVCPYASTWQKKGDAVWKTLTKYQGTENEALDRKIIIEQFKQLIK